jgi:hypothetical protein
MFERQRVERSKLGYGRHDDAVQGPDRRQYRGGGSVNPAVITALIFFLMFGAAVVLLMPFKGFEEGEQRQNAKSES